MNYGRTKALLSRFDPDSPIEGVEVGVNTGLMSEDLLAANKNLFLWMIDNWKEEKDQPEHYKAIGDYHAHLSRAEQDKRLAEAQNRTSHFRRTIIQADSIEAAEKAQDYRFDFVFIDGDHSYEGVKSDIEAWYSKVRAGGYLCGHDYPPNPGFPKFGIKQAVDEAVASHGWELELDIDGTWFCKM